MVSYKALNTVYKSGTMRAIWVSLMVGKGGFDAGKTIKTAF